MTPPLLSDLMTRFLAARPGLPEQAGDAEPHEVLTAFRIDARTAWVEAKEAITLFGGEKSELTPPPEWSAMVRWAETVAVPIAIGNYPQMARDVGRLIAFDLSAKDPADEADFPGLRRWAAKESNSAKPAVQLAAAAVYRLLGQFVEAATTLSAAQKICTGTWATVHANESAALQFARGDFAAAARAWDALPDSPAAAFNRGLARLALGQKEAARPHVQTAAEGLPSGSTWDDLARLYLTLAE